MSDKDDEEIEALEAHVALLQAEHQAHKDKVQAIRAELDALQADLRVLQDKERAKSDAWLDALSESDQAFDAMFTAQRLLRERRLQRIRSQDLPLAAPPRPDDEPDWS